MAADSPLLITRMDGVIRPADCWATRLTVPSTAARGVADGPQPARPTNRPRSGKVRTGGDTSRDELYKVFLCADFVNQEVEGA